MTTNQLMMNKLNRKLYSGFNGATFRVDGDTDIGLGHVIGALRLSKLLKDELKIDGIFRVRKSEVVEHLIQQKGFHVENFIYSSPEKDIEDTIDFALQNRHKTIIFNFCKRDIDAYSYLFNRIRQAGLQLIFQDNPVPPSYRDADLLINALPHPHYEGYDPNKHPACYDGLEYFLVDDVHERLHTKSRLTHKEVKYVLVAMGGGDMDNMTADVLFGLQKINYRGKVDVVLGAANPHKRYIQHVIALIGLDATISQNVADLPDRIMSADIGFSSLGLTTYEMGYLGLPVLLLTRDAFNQSVARLYADQVKAAIVIDDERSDPDGIASVFSSISDDAETRRRMSNNGVKNTGSKTFEILEAFAKILT